MPGLPYLMGGFRHMPEGFSAESLVDPDAVELPTQPIIDAELPEDQQLVGLPVQGEFGMRMRPNLKSFGGFALEAVKHSSLMSLAGLTLPRTSRAQMRSPRQVVGNGVYHFANGLVNVASGYSWGEHTKAYPDFVRDIDELRASIDRSEVE